MRARTGLCLLLLLMATPLAKAQVWAQLNPNASPPARYFHYTATTGAGQVLLFGGRSGGTFYNDTWLWGGSDWMKPPQIGNGPSPRAAHAMCTDDQGRVVLYSGWNNSNYVADTWIYGSGGWTNAQPQNIPSPRDWTSMARDGHGNVVMYGGHDWQLVVAGNGHHDDTWLFDGTNWTQANPTTVPQERWGHAMVYDPSTDSVLMFGGVGNGTGVLNDLWRWDGTNWTQLSPLASPTPRRTVSMVHDPVRNRMVVVGGIDANGQILSDTWEWDGLSWAQTSTGAPALGLTHQSWDPSRQEV